MIDFINNTLGPISIVIGLIASVPIFWTWWQVVFGEPRRLRRWHREACEHVGVRPAILIVDLLPEKDINNQIHHFIANNDKLKSIPKDRIFSIMRDKPLTPDCMPDFLKELRNTSAKIASAGCDTVHCIYAGPVAAAACVGAEFVNGPLVHIYQHQHGTYIDFGPLRLLV